MCKITNELSLNGFSMNPVSKLVERNNGSRTLNTLDYFCICIVMNTSEFIIENKKYEIKRGSLVYIAPQKEVIVCPQALGQDAVFVVAFSSTFYEKAVNDSFLLNSELFFNCDSVTIAQASIPIEEVQRLIIDRLKLYKTKENEGLYVSVAHNCVEALLLDGVFYIDEKVYKNNKDVTKFKAFDVTNKFRILLQKHYKNERQVNFYAEKLYVTPRRLTEMTEATLGKSAKEFIIDKVVNESVRILRNSSLSISEIAYELGFNDEANFSTFIKKHTKRNPSEFKLLKEEEV